MPQIFESPVPAPRLPKATKPKATDQPEPANLLLREFRRIARARVGEALEDVKTAAGIERAQAAMERFDVRKDLLKDDDFYADLLNWRLRDVDPRVISGAPGLVWQSIGGRTIRDGGRRRAVLETALADEAYQERIRYLNAVVPWLLNKEAFAGEPGALVAARNYALATDSTEALGALEVIQALDPLAQQALISILREPAVFEAATREARARLLPTGPKGPYRTPQVVPGLTQAEIDAYADALGTLQTRFGVAFERDDESGIVRLAFPNEDRSIDLVVGLRTLFPQSSYLFKVAGLDALERFTVNPVEETLKAATTAAEVGIEAVTLPFELGITGYKSLLRMAASQGGRLAQATLDLSDEEADRLAVQAAGIAGAPVDAFLYGFEKFDSAVQWTMRNTIGRLVDFSDPEDETRFIAALSGLAEFWILGKAGRLSRAKRLGEHFVPSAAEARLGIDVPLAEKAFGGRVARALGLTRPALHPLQVLNDLINRVGYHLRGVGIRRPRRFMGLSDQVYNTPFIQEAFDKIAAMRERHATVDSHAGAIRAVTGGRIPMDLARRLAHTDRASMEQVFIDYYETPLRTSERVRAISDRMRVRDREIIVLDRPEAIRQSETTIQEIAEKVRDAQREAEGLPERSPERRAAEARWIEQGKQLDRLTESLQQKRDKLMQLRLQNAKDAAEINRLVETAQSAVPAYEYPRVSAVKQFIVGEANTKLARAMHKMFVVPLSKIGFDPLKTVNELPSSPQIISPSASAPPGWREHNADVSYKYLRTAGVPHVVATRLSGRFGSMRSRAELFEWVKEAEEAIDRALPLNTPPEVRYALTHWFDNAAEARGRMRIEESWTNSRGRQEISTEPIVPKKDLLDPSAEATALPSSPTDFVGTFHLPDVNLLVEAMSIYRRLGTFMKRHRWKGGGIYEVMNGVVRTALRLGTTALKAPILILRLPAMIERIQLEQMLRAHFFGGYRGLIIGPHGIVLTPDQLNRFHQGLGERGGIRLLTPDERYARFAPAHEMDLGTIQSILGSEAETTNPTFWTQNMGLVNAGRLAAKDTHFAAYIDTLHKLHKDFFDNRFVQKDLDPAAMKTYVLDHPMFRNYVYEEQLPVLRESALAEDAVVVIPASEAAKLLEFPGRKGRTPEQIEQLRRSIQERGLEGELVIEYNPTTGTAIIPEGHHRIAIAAELGLDARLRFELRDFTGRPLLRKARPPQPLPRVIQKALDDILIDHWLNNKARAIGAILERDPSARRAILTGKYTTVEVAPGFRAATEGPEGILKLSEAYAELQAMREAYQRLASESRIDPRVLSERRGLGLRIRELNRKVRALEREFNIAAHKAGANLRSISLDDRRALVSHLREAFNRGDFSFPATLSVKTRASWFELEGWREAQHHLRLAWNHATSSPFRAATWLDLRGTRGSVYYQVADQVYRDLRRRGYTDETAVVYAQARASAETRDLMYDLSERTSAQRSMRDIFWFAPATQEILYTWFAKIPGQYSGLSGYVLIPARVKAFIDLLRESGVIKKDEDGEDVIIVPGLEPLGAQLKMKTKGFNLVATQPWPSLSTLPAWALGKAEREWGGVFHSLSQFFNQFGADIQFTPRQIIYAWQALTGNNWPGEFLSPEYAKAQYDRAMDQAIQRAFHDKLERGETPPRPEDYETPEAYSKVRDAYMNDLMTDARSYFKGVAFIRLLGSSITPATVYVSDEERAAWEHFFNKVIDPAGNEEVTGRYSAEQKALIEDWIGKHPFSLAYTIGYTVYGEKQRELPYESTGDDAFFDEFYTGERRVLSPEEYAQKLMTVESFRFYVAQKNAALKDISIDAPTLLVNGYQKQQALAEFTENWNRWLTYNPRARALLEESRRAWAERYGLPQNTYETERIANTIAALNEMSGFFTGESGMRLEEFRTVWGQLKKLYSDTVNFGEPTTELGKDLAWYYDTILNPYFEKTETIYAEINAREATGAHAGDLYERLNDLNASYTDEALTHNGRVFPTPEAVFFGNKNPAEQEAAILNWTTKPPTWLSDFRLDKVGIVPVFPRRRELLDRLNDFDTKLNQYIIDRGISPASIEHDKLMAWADRQRYAIAQGYGDAGLRAYEVYNMTPYERLVESGYGAGNSSWQSAGEAAAWVIDNLERNDLSPKGFSERAVFYKKWLYGVVEARRQQDPEYDRLWTDLSYALPERGLTQREGVALYEAVFFGNFNTDFIPAELYQSVEESYQSNQSLSVEG